MRSLALQIVERFPEELSGLILYEDRARERGETDDDPAFDDALMTLVDRIETLIGAGADEPDEMAAIAEAVEILRARDAAQHEAAALRAAATCCRCGGAEVTHDATRPLSVDSTARIACANGIATYGDARADVDRALTVLDAAKRGRDQRVIDEARFAYCDALRAVGRFVAGAGEDAR